MTEFLRLFTHKAPEQAGQTSSLNKKPDIKSAALWKLQLEKLVALKKERTAQETF